MRVIAVVAFFVTLAHALNELLPPRGKVCYNEDLRVGDTLTVTFQVGTRNPSSSDQLDANFYINDPQGHTVERLFHVPDGSPSIQAGMDGRYEYCFSNDYTGITTKDVTFHVNLIKASERGDANTDTLEGQVKLLNRLMMEVQHEQDYIVIRERVHRNTAESTNERVKWWSLFQLVVVVANTAFQVLFLKRFFEVKINV